MIVKSNNLNDVKNGPRGMSIRVWGVQRDRLGAL